MSDHDRYAPYSMVLEWDPRDDIYVATVPVLPGCRTHGVTLDEAVRNGREAMELWIDSARRWGDPIPEPRFFDADTVDAPANEAAAVG